MSRMNLESQEIIKYLVESIMSGKFEVGDLLPKEIDLAKEFKTNRANPNYALKCLEEEKLVTRKKRQGTLLARRPSVVEARRLLAPYCLEVDVSASLNVSFPPIHWNSATLTNLENSVNSHGYSVSYHDFSTVKTREELEEYLATRISLESYALVLLPLHGIECKLILDNYDLFIAFLRVRFWKASAPRIT
jgi:DNA-binding transcriptional regulator YhcF (GntR family)